MMQQEVTKERSGYKPAVPDVLHHLTSLKVDTGKQTSAASDIKAVQGLFPHTFGQPILHFSPGGAPVERAPLKVGVVLSGGQAPGGHNVIAALFDGIKQLHKKSTLLGFLDGPSGIIDNKTIPLTEEVIAPYRNSGGFDMIGSGRTKIETPEQFAAALNTVTKHQLDGVVIVGGDDSNTNAAVLAEYFAKEKCLTKVIGVPKTIDGDLKNEVIETSFGFDTACKTYSELIGNIAKDALSAKKYTHFIKLMGRSASHIALECALAVHPNMAFIAEEKKALQTITKELADLIEKRASIGKHYGVILIPEGLIEFIPEMRQLIDELNTLMVHKGKEDVLETLSSRAKKTFLLCPKDIQEQLVLDRDPHGNVQVSHIETERLLIHWVKEELLRRGFTDPFTPVNHFFGYEGRSGFPSNFDANYTYALGQCAAALIAHGFSGYLATVSNLTLPPEKWEVGGMPITSFLHMEERKGKLKPVIQKALVDINKEPFLTFKKQREHWAYNDDYCCPGPIQLWGPKSVTDTISNTLELEHQALCKGG